MNVKRIAVPVAGAVLMAAAWRSWGWGGIALVLGGIVMWMLLHFTRMTQILKRASGRPIGYVGSAVMLNAKLRPGLTLLHVVGLTRSLGEQLSPKDAQPEVFRWTDESASHVTCQFAEGRLTTWTLERPEPPADEAAAEAQAGQ
jgi:hypothetical protein